MQSAQPPLRSNDLLSCGWVKRRCSPAHKESERRDNEVGAPENKIDWHKPNPDAPAQNLEHRYLDRSSPLTLDYTPWPCVSDSNITAELTGRGDYIQLPMQHRDSGANDLLCARRGTEFYLAGPRLRTSPQFGNALRPGGSVNCFSPVPSALIKKSWN
jgi:hypothetical protein